MLLLFKNGQSQFSFVHITDLHVADGNIAGYIGNYDLNGDGFNCRLSKFRKIFPRPELVIATGDISNVGAIPSDGMYPALTRHLYPHPLNNPNPGDYFIDVAQTIPIYFTPGNHEYFASIVPPIFLSDLSYYTNQVSPDADYVVNKDNATFLFVRSGYDLPFWDGVNPFGAKGNGLNDEQCQWIRNALKSAGNKRKIIVMHHPVRSSSGIVYSDSANHAVPSNDGEFEYNRNTFMNICDSNHVDIVLFGHTHNNIVLNRGGYIVDENWTGGTRYIQTSAEVDGNYRIITVNSSFVSVARAKHVNCSDTKKSDNSESVVLYPNPFNSKAIFLIKMNEGITNYEMRIYSLQGIEVKRISNINGNEIGIERGNLKAGIYYYTLFNSQTLIKGSGKLSIVDN